MMGWQKKRLNENVVFVPRNFIIENKRHKGWVLKGLKVLSGVCCFKERLDEGKWAAGDWSGILIIVIEGFGGFEGILVKL